MKSLNKIVRFVIVFFLGFCFYGFANSVAEAYKSRSNGNIGGELLVIPLIIALIALGYQIKANKK